MSSLSQGIEQEDPKTENEEKPDRFWSCKEREGGKKAKKQYIVEPTSVKGDPTEENGCSYKKMVGRLGQNGTGMGVEKGMNRCHKT